jgi:hypothetical protein
MLKLDLIFSNDCGQLAVFRAFIAIDPATYI